MTDIEKDFAYLESLYHKESGLPDDFYYNRQIKKFPTEKQNVSLKHILT